MKIAALLVRVILQATLGADLPYVFENNEQLEEEYDFIVGKFCFVYCSFIMYPLTFVTFQ